MIDILHILAWAFIAEIIVLIIFEKEGIHVKNRFKGWFNNLNPYINTGYYIFTFLIILIIVGVLEQTTNFLDNFLLNFTGSTLGLYTILGSFDIFWISNQVVGLRIRNKWCWIPLVIFGFCILVFSGIKFIK